MFNWIINLFKKKETEVVAETKTAEVVPPTPAKCGCGRSPTGNCKGYHSLSPSQWDQHEDNPARVVAAPAVETTVDAATLVAEAAAAKVKKPRASKPKATAAADKAAKKPRKPKA